MEVSMVPGAAAVPAPAGLHGSTLECSAKLLMPSAVVRLLASVRRTSLDQELANGGDPAACPILAARAAALAGTGTRRGIAAALERAAFDDGPRLRLAIPRSRPAVAANRTRMLELVDRLRSRAPVYAGGVATLRLLLIDGAGPLYADRHGEGLARALEEAARRLGG
jgi:integrase